MRKIVVLAALLPSLAFAASGKRVGVNPSPQISGNGSSVSVTASGSTTARTLAARAADVVNVLDYGAAPANLPAANDAAFAAAVAALPAVGLHLPGATLVIPPGTYNASASLALAAKSATILAYGAKLVSTAAAAAIDIGQDSYITDLGAGYYGVTIKGLEIVPAAGATAIRNKGMRKLILEDVRTFGGATGLDSEGAWGGLEVRGAVFQNATVAQIHLRQRNNNALFEHARTLGGGLGGKCVLIDSASFGAAPGAENKGITFERADVEGCAGGVELDGNLANVDFVGHFEDNTLFNVKLHNDAGTFNKYGVTIRNSQISGAGDDVLIGTDAAGTQIEGVTLYGNEFADSNLTWTGPIANSAAFNNMASGTSTVTSRFFAGSSTITGPAPRFVMGQDGWAHRQRLGLGYGGDVLEVGSNVAPTATAAGNLDDVANNGFVLRMQTTGLRIYSAYAGANPRTLTERLHLDVDGVLTIGKTFRQAGAALPTHEWQSTGWTVKGHAGLPYAGDQLELGINLASTADAVGALDDIAAGGAVLRLGAGGAALYTASSGANPRTLTGGPLAWKVAVPATAATACTVGQWAADLTTFYVCAATDTWRRVGIVAW